MKTILLLSCLALFNMQAFAAVKDANNQKILSLIQNGVPIIDIRTASEWNDTGVIKHSNLITFFDEKGNYNLEEWLSKLKKIAKEGDPVIIICRSGRRSGIVSKLLDEKIKYTSVYNASGGILSWIRSKNEIIQHD